MSAVASRALALVMLGALGAAALVYPLDKVLLGAILLAYCALLWWRPQLWLLVLPALLPVLDLAPWTGWFFLEELDLLLLATGAVGYWRLGPNRPQMRLPPFMALLLGVLACSFALAGVIGMTPLAPLDANAFSTYNSPYNSLRVAKGLAWALLLLPLLRRSAGASGEHLTRLLVPGMLLGLAGCALAVVWERAVFPGLFNFSSDYRPTAPFSAMHTGGAALDAYLAISFPFVALWLMTAGSRLRLALALVLLLLGCYAGLATFSRDVYLAYGTSVAVLAALTLSYRLRRGTLEWRVLIITTALLLVLAFFLARMFGTSGYRGLLAALMLLSGALIMATARERIAPLAGAAALLAVLAALGLYFVADKGAYLGFALSAALFGGAALLFLLSPQALRTRAMALAAGGFAGMALGAVLVALHWGGSGALQDAAIIVVLALAIVAVNRIAPQPLWQLGRNTLSVGALCAIVFAVTIPIAGSYHTGSRFATVEADIQVRLSHWNEALDMMRPDWTTRLFGMGLGRYPATYFWHNTHAELPGSYRYLAEPGARQSLRLGTARYGIGYGEVLRMLQHVPLRPDTRYRFSVDIRSPAGAMSINVQVCERWLIFPRNCVNAPIKLSPTGTAWQPYSSLFTSPAAPATWLPVPTQLEMSASGAGHFLDIDNVSLIDIATGEQLLKNGSFSSGNDYWFFSSDRNHFPWHAKNFVINTVFETGWLGLAAMTLFLVYLAGVLAMRGLQGELPAAVYLAALSGFMVVGLFDSLFDVPRLTLLFFLLACAICLVPVKPVTPTRPQRRRVRRAKAEAAPAA